MLNKVFLQGRLVADPELRHTTSGVAVASIRLAVDRDFKDRETGEKKADFVNVVAWRGTAEFASRYFTKAAWLLWKVAFRFVIITIKRATSGLLQKLWQTISILVILVVTGKPVAALMADINLLQRLPQPNRPTVCHQQVATINLLS